MHKLAKRDNASRRTHIRHTTTATTATKAAAATAAATTTEHLNWTSSQSTLAWAQKRKIT